MCPALLIPLHLTTRIPQQQHNNNHHHHHHHPQNEDVSGLLLTPPSQSQLSSPITLDNKINFSLSHELQ
jgi:hypothetical protein